MEIFAVIGVAVVLMLILLAFDHKFWAAVATMVLIGVVIKLNWQNVTLDRAFFMDIGLMIAAFIGIGFGFTFLKWKMHTIKIARSFKEYLERKSSSELETIGARQMVANGFNRRSNIVQVKADGVNGWKTDYDIWNLGQYVTSWVVFWPFYAVLLVLDDVIMNLVHAFVSHFGRVFRAISDSSFSSIN
jgi:hypothetical protein